MYTHIHVHAHTYMHTHMAHIYAHAHTYIHARAHTHTCTHIHAHTYMHAHTHTYIHTRTHTHTCTRTRIQSGSVKLVRINLLCPQILGSYANGGTVYCAIHILSHSLNKVVWHNLNANAVFHLFHRTAKDV